jgi:predicted flap endonuclease-1-like 5' DNA nuclease
MKFLECADVNNTREETEMNTVLGSLVGCVGLLLAGIGVAALLWFLWWLWKRSEEEKEELGIEIRAEEAEVDASMPAARAEAVDLEEEVPDVAVEAETPDAVVEADLPEAEADVPEVEAELPEADVAPPEPDNLQRIDGIGPKMSSVLQAGGITTFAALANADEDQIRQILEDADPRLLRLASLETWREQAALAAAGDWDGLEELQGGLKGGRRR